MMGDIAPRSNGGFKAVLDNSNLSGVTARDDGAQSLVAGAGAYNTGQAAIVIGMNSRNSGSGNTIIGRAAQSTAGTSPGVALGAFSWIAANATININAGSAQGGAFATNSIAIGNGPVVNTSASNAIAIGSAAVIDASAVSAIAIGASARARITNGISIGNSTDNLGGAGVAIGSSATINAASASGPGVVIGSGSGGTSWAEGSINIGNGMGGITNAAIGAIAIGTALLSGGTYAPADASLSIGIGHGHRIDFTGEVSWSTGAFAARGDTKVGMFPMRMSTSNATPTEMGTAVNNNTTITSTTPNGRIVLTNNSSYIFDCQIVARQSSAGTDYAAFQLTFLITREANAAATALVGAPVATVIAATAGAAAWTVGVTADTTNGRPNISVTGAAATNIRWVANVRMTKVSG